jgi:hypothetical protein
METVSRTQENVEELKGRLDALEQQKASLESEISVLVEQIPILELDCTWKVHRYAGSASPKGSPRWPRPWG